MEKKKKEIVADIREMFGAVGVLYSEQVAQYLGKSTKGLYDLRSGGGFAVPVVMVGGRPAVTVLDFAEWLAGGSQPESKAKVGVSAAVPPPMRKRERLEIMLRGLLDQQNFLADLHTLLEGIVIAESAEEAHQSNADLDRETRT